MSVWIIQFLTTLSLSERVTASPFYLLSAEKWALISWKVSVDRSTRWNASLFYLLSAEKRPTDSIKCFSLLCSIFYRLKSVNRLDEILFCRWNASLFYLYRLKNVQPTRWNAFLYFIFRVKTVHPPTRWNGNAFRLDEMLFCSTVIDRHDEILLYSIFYWLKRSSDSIKCFSLLCSTLSKRKELQKLIFQLERTIRYSLFDLYVRSIHSYVNP